VREISFQYLWHQIVVFSDEPELLAAVRSRFQSPTYGFAPDLRLPFTMERLGAELALHDGLDLVGRYTAVPTMLDEFSLRVVRRVTEFASLKGWKRYHGTTPHDAFGRAALLLAGAGFVAPQAEVLVGPDLSALEVPAVEGRGPTGEPVRPHPLCALFVAELNESVQVDDLSPLAATRCLIESSVSVTESRGALATAATGLVNAVYPHRLRCASYDQAARIVTTLDVASLVR
jgi:hypothetical protein